jgi:fatty acid synthase subunit beta
VKQNPKYLTITFSGKRGSQVRQNYLDFQTALQRHSGSKSTSTFPGLHASSRSYTFRGDKGLLATTQFAQPAICVLEFAAFKGLESLGRLPTPGKLAAFAGHSLGELAALACMTDAFPLETMLKVAFARGVCLQVAVSRDEQGRSDFAMVAVDPSRVGRAFTEVRLTELVHGIMASTGSLLEVVNFNVARKQYVCAGDKRCLDTLRRVTDALHANDRLLEQPLAGLVAAHLYDADTSAASVQLVRGKATIPLQGIDVPFHSSLLQAQRGMFFEMLKELVPVGAIDPVQLESKWVPNVTGKPFKIDVTYLGEVARLTESKHLLTLLEDLGDSVG